MSSRAYKGALLATAAVLLILVGFVQKSLNEQRANPELGLLRGAGLGTNAPPVLAFTTVALGGFRGLIANSLWIRMNDLQLDGKYFEMVQLADWITKMEPSLTQVWIVQAWNMAFNISVKFPNPYDRWRWVQRGIELLRDDGLRYNPRDALMYRELAWFFQFKMGANMDDAHKIYKQEWAKEMTNLFGSGRPNYAELLNPTTDEARQRVQRLVEHYKMDPRLMKEADDTYGPLEWRLPEAHAIYWAYVGLKESKKKELITLRRVLYQSMHQSFLHGRLLSLEPLSLAPDFPKAEKLNATYEQMIKEETVMPDSIKRPHANWLKEVVYVCYANNATNAAMRWFTYLREKYPDAVPPSQSLDEFAVERIVGNIPSLNNDQARVYVISFIRNYYVAYAQDDDERAFPYERFARTLHKRYNEKNKGQQGRIGLPPFDEMKRDMLKELVDPASGLKPAAAARLRERLNLAPPSSQSTNSPPMQN